MSTLFWLIFVIVFVVVLGAVIAWLSYADTSEKKAMIQRLGNPNRLQPKTEPSRAVLGQAHNPAAKKTWVQSVPGMKSITRQIGAAGLDWRPESVLFSMLGLAVLGAVIGAHVRVLIFTELSALGLALFLGSLPYQLLARKRKKRMETFEGQFPDTLDFIARAITAGHALSVSLEMLANESPEPTRTEFRRIFTEHNLGASLDMALKGLVDRVPLVVSRFFVSAVLVQRETGGNLSEILTNLGEVIRDRFTLKGKVKAASAHGRMTATALTIIPIAVLGLMAIMNPDYLKPLRDDHDGRLMALGAIAGQVVGYFVMKRIIDIKV